MTISRMTPIEIAFGRRPPPLVDYERANPEKLTTADPLRGDKVDREVRKLALRAHVESRQHDDPTKDLAQNVRPSEGPSEANQSVPMGQGPYQNLRQMEVASGKGTHSNWTYGHSRNKGWHSEGEPIQDPQGS